MCPIVGLVPHDKYHRNYKPIALPCEKHPNFKLGNMSHVGYDIANQKNLKKTQSKNKSNNVGDHLCSNKYGCILITETKW